jgi:hypothetical protein
MRDSEAVVGWCAAYALALEIMQLAVPKRHPEISDVLTAALGAGLGSYAWRWFAALGVAAAPQSAATAPIDTHAATTSRTTSDALPEPSRDEAPTAPAPS